jgi:xanthine dehydrogenase accessory factor
MSTMFDSLRHALEADEAVALVTVVDGPGVGGKLLCSPHREPEGTLGDEELDRVVLRDTLGELEAGRTGVRRYGAHGEASEDTVSVFIESFTLPPRMLLFGAVDFTAALVRVARVLGYRTTVCDARPVFATQARFPFADEVLVSWPNRLLDDIGSSLTKADAVCILTHDPKFDVPAIMSALRTDVGYIGVMGSRRTHEKRIARLVEAGATDADLAQLHSPIGLDVGARTPEETAVSICAEIIAVRAGKSTAQLSLTNREGPIHA